MNHSAGPQSRARGAKIPCWPNPSPLTIFFTRDLNRFIYRFAYAGALILFVLLFLFSQQIDHLLTVLGYNSDFVSYFPFLRALYAHLISSVRVAHLSTAYFHILDVCLCVSLAIWGGRLTAGVFFLRQYDGFYRGVSLAIARTPRLKVYGGLLGAILILLTPFFLTWDLMRPDTLKNPETILVLNLLPSAFFLSLAVMYFFCTGVAVEVSLFLLWRILRQRRAVLSQ